MERALYFPGAVAGTALSATMCLIRKEDGDTCVSLQSVMRFNEKKERKKKNMFRFFSSKGQFCTGFVIFTIVIQSWC